MTPPPTLLLQSDVFPEEATPEAEGLIRAAFSPCPVQIVPDREVVEGSPRLRSHDGPFRGSLNMAMRMGRLFDFTNAQYWAPALRHRILSEDYYFLDAASVLDRFPSSPSRLFVRPASGFKAFRAAIYNRESFADEIRALNLDPTIICLVATPMGEPPSLEWRMIFLNRILVGSSQYMENSVVSLSSGAPEEVALAALTTALDPYFLNVPDFVLDFALTPDGLKLVEVNAFETSSFYASDQSAIFKAWGQAWAQNWAQTQRPPPPRSIKPTRPSGDFSLFGGHPRPPHIKIQFPGHSPHPQGKTPEY